MHHKHFYIMQWFSPTSGAEGPAQLNFFYEVLSSANYKGSMTSLQSGFSSSSAASSCQSRWYEANNGAACSNAAARAEYANGVASDDAAAGKQQQQEHNGEEQVHAHGIMAANSLIEKTLNWVENESVYSANKYTANFRF